MTRAKSSCSIASPTNRDGPVRHSAGLIANATPAAAANRALSTSWSSSHATRLARDATAKIITSSEWRGSAIGPPQSSSAFARFTAGASGLLKLSLPVARLVTCHFRPHLDAHHSPSADPTLSPASRRVVLGLNADRSHAVTALPVFLTAGS